jgi:hypothetical protein
MFQERYLWISLIRRARSSQCVRWHAGVKIAPGNNAASAAASLYGLSFCVGLWAGRTSWKARVAVRPGHVVRQLLLARAGHLVHLRLEFFNVRGG